MRIKSSKSGNEHDVADNYIVKGEWFVIPDKVVAAVPTPTPEPVVPVEVVAVKKVAAKRPDAKKPIAPTTTDLAGILDELAD